MSLQRKSNGPVISTNRFSLFFCLLEGQHSFLNCVFSTNNLRIGYLLHGFLWKSSILYHFDFLLHLLFMQWYFKDVFVCFTFTWTSSKCKIIMLFSIKERLEIRTLANYEIPRRLIKPNRMLIKPNSINSWFGWTTQGSFLKKDQLRSNMFT